MSISNYYQVGASLEYQHPSYVKRQADDDLIEKLKNGEYCYVLNSRQMGKSSLRVQVMKKLEEQGFKCAVIEMTEMDKHTTAQQFYAGLVTLLLDSESFNLSTEIDFNTWWEQQKLLPPLLRFRKFIKDELLRKFNQNNIVIFFDEIDRMIECTFKEDFFAFIRNCCNQRVDNPEYKRLTFCLLGVATPSDLIADKSFNTPFNIGRAIELNGFQLKEATPLAQGLEGKIGNPEAVLAQVLAWTGGQPFLTQKLCTLILTADSCPLAGSETEWVENLVRSQVIENWESQDQPQHLRTISNRLLNNEQRAPRLLGLYQQILQQGEVIADDSPEQMELRLSGLVVKQQGKLKVYNPIYKSVFDENWVEKELANLRPLFFSEALKRWKNSNCQEKSWLLRGQALRDARKWAKGRSLTGLGHQFLDASQELENEEIQRENEEVQRRNEEIQREKEETRRKKLIKQLTFVIGVFIILLVVSVTLFVQTNEAKQNILARSLLEQAELITQPDLLPIRVALSIKAIESSNSVQVKPFLYDDLALLPRVNPAVDKDRGSVNAVAFSPHGKYLATAGLAKSTGLDGYVCMFERSKKQESQYSSCMANKNKVGNVNAVAFSPNRQYLATASVDGKTCVWDTTSGKEIKCIDPNINSKGGLKVGANAVSFSPDGKYLATARTDGEVSVLETNSYKEIKSMEHSSSVLAMTFNPVDGRYLATASVDGKTCVWDTTSGDKIKCTKPKDGLKVGANAVSFSPDGKYLATAGADGEVSVLETNSYNPKYLIGHNSDEHNNVLAMTFSPTGQYLATASVDGTVRVWETNVKKKPAQWKLRHKLSHNEPVTNVAFSLDDNYLATASSDKTARVWNLNSGDEFARLIHNDEVNAIAFNPNNNSLLATASADGAARVWDLNSDRIATRVGHKEEVNAKAFSDDGKHIVTASNNKTGVWSATSGYQQFVLSEEGVTHVTFSKEDGKYLATVSSGEVKVWNTANGEEALPSPSTKNVNSVAMSPDGKYLAIATLNQVELYLIPSGKKDWSKPMDDEQYTIITSIVFSPDNRYLATVSRDNTVCMREVKTGEKVLNSCVENDANVDAVTFSEDSKLLATASRDSTVKVLEISNGGKPKEFPHKVLVTAVSFSKDGKYLATGDDKTAYVWEVSKAETSIATMKHKAPVTAVSFSRDDKYLVTASKDNTLRVWETTNDKTPVETILHKEPVTAVAFSSDGKRLATMSGKTVRVLPWERQTLINDACNYLTRNLTPEEWKHYVGVETYHKTCRLLP